MQRYAPPLGYARTTPGIRHRDRTSAFWIFVGNTLNHGRQRTPCNERYGFDASDLPHALAKRAPAYGKVPGLFLSWLAVDLTAQGLGLGRALLADVLQRAIAVAQQIGIAVIVLDVLDVLDDDDEAIAKRTAFYKTWGYQSFPSTPLRMFGAIHR